MEIVVFTAIFALCWAAFGAMKFLKIIVILAGVSFCVFMAMRMYHDYITVPATAEWVPPESDRTFIDCRGLDRWLYTGKRTDGVKDAGDKFTRYEVCVK